MRYTLVAVALALVSDVLLADNYTRPYVKRDGTVVEGYHSTEPNQYRFDNYSGRGNTNPYTGERGSQRHEFTNPPEYNTGRRGQDSGSGSYPNPYMNPYSNPYETPSRGRNRY